MEAVYDVYIGFVVGARHSAFLVSRGFYNILVQPILTLLGIRGLFDRDQEINNTEGLKVVAVGYGRTGTVSAFYLVADFAPSWWHGRCNDDKSLARAETVIVSCVVEHVF